VNREIFSPDIFSQKDIPELQESIPEQESISGQETIIPDSKSVRDQTSSIGTIFKEYWTKIERFWDCGCNEGATFNPESIPTPSADPAPFDWVVVVPAGRNNEQ
jgi:hypothetical protein